MAIERTPHSASLLGTGGAGAAVLLIPYLLELTHTPSGTYGGNVHDAPFAFTIRQMLPPDGLMASGLFQRLAIVHPQAALGVVKLVLLVPGYALELGFYLAIIIIYLTPALRGRIPLTSAQRSLAFIAVTTLVFVTFIRSTVLRFNDFGFRGALLVQFSLLLLGSEILTGWSLTDSGDGAPLHSPGLPFNTPHWFRSIAAFALVIGVMSTASQALWMRFATLLAEGHLKAEFDPNVRSFSHNAYISSIGYAQLDRMIQHNAVVQFNPIRTEPFWWATDLLGINHQATIVNDQPWCGAELGGNPSGCTEMASAIDILFNGATAEQARRTCHNYGIQILVARIYDQPWKDKSSWVWTLKPVVSDNEFRALDCRQ